VDGAANLDKEPCKVLVVDDERDTADTAVMLLRLWGHEAEAAYSADDAMSKAFDLDPDVVLVDLVMPETNGLDLAKELRAVCPDAKFLAITGFTRADIVRRAHEAGFERVLLKPAPASVLQQVVESECAAGPPETPRLRTRTN
jgi:CheY-like chemotaxis protein